MSGARSAARAGECLSPKCNCKHETLFWLWAMDVIVMGRVAQNYQVKYVVRINMAKLFTDMNTLWCDVCVICFLCRDIN
jgi:hypothetical protein